MGRGIAVQSPEAKGGGLSVQERQDGIVLVFKRRDVVLGVLSTSTNSEVAKYFCFESTDSLLNFDFKMSMGMICGCGLLSTYCVLFVCL